MIGRGFSVRHVEHKNQAKAKIAHSCFYLCYPAENNARGELSTRKGYFDNLPQSVAFGFDIGNRELSPRSTSELDKGDFFHLIKIKRIELTQLR